MEPVFRAANQKKPKGLRQRVFATLEEQETHAAIAAMAFDGERNAFTVVSLGKKKTEFVVDLPDLDGPPPPAPTSKPLPSGAAPKASAKKAAKAGAGGGPRKDEVDRAERRKWTVTLTDLQRIDASVLQEYSKGSAQAAQVQGVAFTTIMALNVLLRANPARSHTPVGGGGTASLAWTAASTCRLRPSSARALSKASDPANLAHPTSISTWLTQRTADRGRCPGAHTRKSTGCCRGGPRGGEGEETAALGEAEVALVVAATAS